MDDTEETVAERSVVAIGSQKVLSHFFNDEEPVAPTVTVNFQVDMRYYMREMKFDASTQYVDIAGSLNGWDGTNHHLADENADSVYNVDVAINTTDIGTTFSSNTELTAAGLMINLNFLQEVQTEDLP